jgi:hypothetical protein
LQTKNIRLGPGGFLLPYHHPAELANRVAVLDHLSGERLNLDYKHKPEAWYHSLSLLKQEVMPRLKHLGTELGRAA